mgnify:CR=1 FL=1
MVTFSNWLTCDALFWFIEFLFEITSSDQRAHSLLTTFCSTSHLLSIPQGCSQHQGIRRALRQDLTFESRDRKSFQNVKIKSFTIGQDRQHTLQREAAVSPSQIQFQSALKQLHLNIKEPISSCDLSLVNLIQILVQHWSESSSGSISGNIPNCLLGQFESWNGTESLQSQTFFAIELRARC